MKHLIAAVWLWLTAAQSASAFTPEAVVRLQSAARAEAAQGFTGSVLVAQHGRILLDRAYGNIRGARIRTHSRFWIASIGKQFTSAAIMRCVEAGRLRLDTPLSEIWRDTPADKGTITVAQILSHSSGLPQSNDAELVATGEEAREIILALPLGATPGDRFIYSNANYELAAAIIERACDASYNAYVTDMIRRAHLHDTGQFPNVAAPRVVPFVGERPGRLDRLRWGGQGFFSTTHDLYRWRQALRAGRVVSTTSVAALFEPRIAIQEGQAAFGWFVGRSDRGSERVFTRGNEDSGPNGLLYFYPATDVTIIVLTHSGDKNDDTSWSRAMLASLEAALDL